MNVRLLVTAVLLGFLCLASTGCVAISLFPRSEVREVVFQPGSAFRPAKIGIVDVSGVIVGGGEGDGVMSRDGSTVSLGKKLRMIERDPRVKAVILRIDSPGGGVTASDTMYHEVKRFKEKTGIPVYVSMVSLAASGGYYVAMAADEITAHPTTITGSIGVVTGFPQATGLMDMIGVKWHSITSGPQKDSGAFYREFTDEDRAIFQALIDDMYEKFLAIVAENRKNIDEAKLRELADGRVYTADQAREAGLIDSVMYLDELVEHVKKEQKLRNPAVVIYTASVNDTTDSLYATQRGSASPEVNLVRINASPWEAMGNGEPFQYLWVP
jgi:protease-4